MSSTFIQNSKLVFTPSLDLKSQQETKQFKLSRLSYLWDVPKFTDDVFDILPISLLDLFLRDCREEDYKKLNKNSYLRFMCYQDEPDSYPYIYAYIRGINECTEQHKSILSRIPEDYLSCEINFSTKGYFFIFPIKEWENKKVDKMIGID